MNDVVTQDSIYQLQEIIKEFPKADVVTRHHFSDGMYAREMVMPAGSIVVGALHKSKIGRAWYLASVKYPVFTREKRL